MSNDQVQLGNGAALARLRAVLEALPRGAVEKVDLDVLLAKAWPELRIDHDPSHMTADKLYGRMEAAAWDPPFLTFTIERHGPTVHGSKYAQLHAWRVDVHKAEAHCADGGKRLLHPLQPPLDVEPLADEIATLIIDGRADPRLRWPAPMKLR